MQSTLGELSHGHVLGQAGELRDDDLLTRCVEQAASEEEGQREGRDHPDREQCVPTAARLRRGRRQYLGRGNRPGERCDQLGPIRVEVWDGRWGEWLAEADPLDVGAHVDGGLVPVAGALGQRPHHQRVARERDVWIDPRGRRRGLADVLVRHGDRRVADERRPSAEQLIEHATDGVQVAAGVDQLAPRLLG